MGSTVTFILVLAGPAAVGYFVWRALNSARTAQGAAAWTVFLLLAPWFAIPSYLVFGHHKLRLYRAARQKSRRVISQIDAFGRAHPPGRTAGALNPAFERLAGMPFVGGNGARLLIDGAATFEAIFAAIDAAEDYVCVQFYTIAADGLGDDLAERLIAAARRGVAVRVIYDGVGSQGLAKAYIARLREAGVRVVDPRLARGPTSKLEVNFRNHRKTVLIDGRIGFLGGLNVSDDYLGKNETYGRWRDTHMEIRGPMVAQLQLIYAEDWHWATDETLEPELIWTPGDDPEDLTGLIVAMGPGDEFDTGSQFFLTAIQQAERRLWIASAYFVPDVEVLSGLKNAALRGVDVRLMVPEVVDHYLPWLAAFAYFDELRAAGVSILRYHDGFLHQKVLLVDEALAAVGSANLDNRSLRLNFETMALMPDSRFAREVEAMLEEDMKRTRPLESDLDSQPLWVRAGAPLARLVAPIL